jgi:predicted N-formylglutamate amidohydrolase
LLLVADHAMRRFPPAYGTLGLPESELQRHIAYDIGVEALTRALATQLQVPAVMATFSRLLIDANRGEDDPTLIRQIYDRTLVPGNRALDDGERMHRLTHFFRPYHAAIDAEIAAMRAASGKPPLVIALHSFTPRLANGRQRPWHCGILWDRDPRAAQFLLAALRRETGLCVGDNEPYDGALKGDTMYAHCSMNGLAHGLIEVRQDLIADAAGIAHWTNRLAPVIDALNHVADMHDVQYHGSRAQ